MLSPICKVQAEQHGPFTYSIDNGVTITDCSESFEGDVVIPGEINGLPVKALGWESFSNKLGLTGITIPATVVSISHTAFDESKAVTSIDVHPANSVFGSDDGVLFSKDKTRLIRFPEGKAGIYHVPDGVLTIADETNGYARNDGPFEGCALLAKVTIPASVASISFSAFNRATSLTSITVDAGNSHYASVDGVLFNKDKTNLLRFPGGKAGDYRIPDGVTTFSNARPGRAGVRVYGAFEGCAHLTAIALPESVARVGDSSFIGCSNLTSISVDPGNPNFSSADGVLFDAGMSELLRFPLGRGGAYTIPEGVTKVRGTVFHDTVFYDDRIGAFHRCVHLTSIVVPSSVDTLGNDAFEGCKSLGSAIFLGDAPRLDTSHGLNWSTPFHDVAPGFSIFILSSRSGFTSGLWAEHLSREGHSLVVLEESEYPTASWLVAHGLQYDAALDQDINGDGVSLLMAYALNLDPRRNLRSSLPTPEFEGDSLSMTYHAASHGITYTVQTSTDLQEWNTTGVKYTDSEREGSRKASVQVGNAPARYLRLIVEDASLAQ